MKRWRYSKSRSNYNPNNTHAQGAQQNMMDVTQYFASNRISCPGCLKKIRGKNEKIQYSHQVLSAAIVNLDKRHVIPLAPEPIQNHDGTDKQDCEINAGKRLIKRIRQDHPKLKIIEMKDRLYQQARVKFSARKELWSALRTLIKFIVIS